MEAFYSGTFSTETFYSVARQPYPVERQLSPIKSSFPAILSGASFEFVNSWNEQLK